MRTSQFTEHQRRFALLAVEAGWTVTFVCRVFGITRMTFYRWKKELTTNITPEMRALLAALQAGPRDMECLEAGLEALAPPPKPRKPTRKDADRELARQLRGLATLCRNMGYRRLHEKLLEQGIKVGLARTYRIYQSEGLALRRMRKKADPDGRVGKYPKDLRKYQ
jgi:hypothetical protein